MITFKSRQEVLKSADMIGRNAKNLYPHISTSRIKTYLDPNKPKPEFYEKYARNIKLSRKIIRNSKDLYSSVIYALQSFKIGNCTEEAIFAEVLGRINGQKNIYSGGIFFNNKDGKQKMLDHAVAFITNKPVKNGKAFKLKNKDTIIIDPWLGITDFAENYFTKIKCVFRSTFKNLPNNNFEMAVAKLETKTPDEYKKFLKECGSHIEFYIIPFLDKRFKNTPISLLKEIFPELIFKNFKQIELPKLTKPTFIEKK